MPSRKGYGETHSASRFHDFQARRLNLRYRDATGKVHFCHTLNNTVIASPRILIPILENYQQADGSVVVPAGPAALHGRPRGDPAEVRSSSDRRLVPPDGATTPLVRASSLTLAARGRS